MNKLKIEVKGKNPDYFLKEIIKRNINIYNLEKNYNSIRLIINYEDYEKILKIKTSYKISIIEKYGLLKLKDNIKKYFYFILFITAGILSNILLSNIIFNIEISHPNKELVKLVKEDLEKLGLKKYHFKVKNKEGIKKKILDLEKDRLEWIEIENIGTKYIIKIEERKKNTKKEKCNERNIVAKKDAIIIDIDASIGEVQKKKNDYVEKDEVVISGFIYNKDNVVSKKCATGKIYGEVWYNVKVLVPQEYSEVKKLDKVTRGISINIFNKEINNTKLEEYLKEDFRLIDSKIIPININYSKYQEIKKVKNIYTINNVDDKAIEISTKKMKEKLKNDEDIISKKVLKKTKKNSKIEVEVFFKVKEDITSYKDISKIDIEEMNKKEE